ncbi:MAG: transketolase C-terminal domain-containing protein, partial [Pirellulaceae bacterium]
TAEGIKARVVSMPCLELFEAQSPEYKNSVLPPEIAARVAVEAGLRQSWDRYLGFQGKFVGMNGFGASGPAGEVFNHFGITTDHIVASAKEVAGK